MLILIGLNTHAETIYKTVDENGNVSFSGEPSYNSVKVKIHVSPPSTDTTVANDVERYKQQNKADNRRVKNIKDQLTLINAKLIKLAQDKKNADAEMKKCMQRPRIMFEDFSNCKPGTVKPSKTVVSNADCVIVTNMPTTKENCTHAFYPRLLKLIKKLEDERSRLNKEIQALSM